MKNGISINFFNSSILVYAWVEENIPYFRKMSDANNAKSWKNSIRHNLSLHKQFYKVLREGNRSCLWGCDRNRIVKHKEHTPKVKSVNQAPIKSPQVNSPSTAPQSQAVQSPVQLATIRPRANTEPTNIRVRKIVEF